MPINHFFYFGFVAKEVSLHMEQKITILDKTFVPYLPEEELLEGIQKVADRINKDYAGKKPLFLSVLNGSFMFTSDLMKRITLDCEISFVKLSSYEKLNSTGIVKELIGLNQDIEGRDILILEDIIDTGNSMASILPSLKVKKPGTIELVTLLHKPEALEKELDIKYIAFNIPNKFVVGYGLDYDQLGRNYPDLYQLGE